MIIDYLGLFRIKNRNKGLHRFHYSLQYQLNIYLLNDKIKNY